MYKKIQNYYYKLRGIKIFGIQGRSFFNSPMIKGKLVNNIQNDISIGDKLKIFSYPWKTQITVQKNAKLKIGNNVFVNSGCDIACNKSITIGDNVLIGTRTVIIDSNYHSLDISYTQDDICKPIVIKDNVWIGTRVTILPGVTIGKNSVIASGSIVVKDIPENVLAGGNPAKIIKNIKVSDGWVRT